MMKKTVWFLPTALYITFIITMSFRPAPKLPRIEQIDKLVHGAAYAVLAFLSYLSFSRTGFKKPVLWAIALPILVGGMDEFLQSFNPARTASIYDLMADSVGALLAGSLANQVHTSKKQQ